MLHLLGTLLLVPYVVLAAFFLLVGRAAAAGSWWNLVDLLAGTACWSLRFGLPLAVLGILLLAAGGVFAGTQRLAAMVLAGLAGLVLLVLLLWPKQFPDTGQLLFLFPCVLVFTGSLCRVLAAPTS